MDENRFEGAAGALVGDGGLEAKGKLNEVAGSAQNLYGRAVNQARAAAGGAQDLIGDQPVASAALALVAGVALGLLIGMAL